MAGEEDRGVKFFFRATALTSAPVLAVAPATRIHCVMFNEGPSPLRIGSSYISGSLSTLGMLLPSGATFYDYYSDDDWWIQAVGAASGTVSGFIVEGL